MNNKTFLTLHGGIYTAFAIALFFLPHVMWPMYGVEINDQYAYFLSQHTSIFWAGWQLSVCCCATLNTEKQCVSCLKLWW